MKTRLFALFLLLCASYLFAEPPASRPDAPASQPATSAPATQPPADLIAVMETAKGDVRIKLAQAESGRTVAYFVNLVQRGIYDDYHVSGGRPQYKTDFGGPQDIGDPGATMRCEYNGKTKFTGPGDVGMQQIRSEVMGACFFITTSHLKNRDLSYPIIGRVIEGQSIVERMAIGEAIKGIRLEGDPSKLLRKYAKDIAKWNEAMAVNPTQPGASSTK
jgi:peptidyl-prolyl cis-trans isomerase B (cyclophilin B)